jgi:NAD(P) transhydrogenase subunit alpha|tara:strand:- start:4695 stop:5123 length:429 start_codon:yes stop_codon:yes gene_type:complete
VLFVEWILMRESWLLRLPVAALSLALLGGGQLLADETTSRVGSAQGVDGSELLILLYIFVLASFLGHQLITRVPPLLHTPLMSGTNAISGISLVGSLVAAGLSEPVICNVLGGVAVGCAMCNVVGGFAITDRMLAKFRKGSR